MTTTNDPTQRAQDALRALTDAAVDLHEAMLDVESATGQPFGTEGYPWRDDWTDMMNDIIDWRDASAPIKKTQTVDLKLGEQTVLTLTIPVPENGNPDVRARNLRIVERAEQKIEAATGQKPTLVFHVPFDPRG